MEKIKQLWKKIPKAGKICFGVLILILFCVTYLVRRSAPLDRIRLYEVSVKPLEDGALEIRYHLNWTVKNDKREGPLLNVRIGMANYNYELIGAGGDILKEQRRSDSDRESGDAAMADGKDGGGLSVGYGSWPRRPFYDFHDSSHLLPRKNSLHFMEKGVIIHKIT